MAIRGHVDTMEGSYLTGWATSVPDTGNCAITVTDQEGKLLAKGRASRHRPDLAALGLGRTTFGYRIAVPLSEEPRLLRILGNGEELIGSPVAVGPGLFDGLFSLEGDQLVGWVSERAPAKQAPFITVRNQAGQEVGRGQSVFEAQPADPLFAPARFRLTLDADCFGAGEMLLEVAANGQNIGRTSCNLALRAHLETITPTRMVGWVLSPDVPKRIFALDVYRNGILEETDHCDLERTDVQAHFPDSPTPGFDISLDPLQQAADQPVSLTLRFAGGKRDLFDGPYLLAGRPAAVAALQRAAHLAHAGLPGIGTGERALLTAALQEFLAKMRAQDGLVLDRQPAPLPAPGGGKRVAIVMPIYRGVEVTQACIESVLAHRQAETDLLVLINDASPDEAMAPMLAGYAGLPNVVLLENGDNLGFVGSVNRGLALVKGSDVLLLNSDTVMFAGGLDELLRVAAADPAIGTVTAMSSNATIFSYPSAELREAALADISWPELAALALAENAGLCVDVPTGHGFCMLIKAEVMARIGALDEAFGRGYGEENDFCARAAALGYRNVAAGGVIVEHKESISFGNERASLVAQNQPRLNALYPEYTPLIMAFEDRDGLRQLRWALDRARLARARAQGARFALVTSNALEGGTPKAIRDIEREVGYGGATRLSLSVTESGLVELSCATPLLCAHFNKDEAADLFALLDVADPRLVLAHQLLGFPASVIAGLRDWLGTRHSLYWAHDFYALCPRVTMIDAIGRFCGGADAATCGRCVEMGGAHETSVLNELSPAEHRALFDSLLAKFTHVIAPSENAVGYLRKVFAQIKFNVLPHPESRDGAAAAARAGNDTEIVMLGAIGPHKGSDKLLEIARRARLTHPHLSFRVIGYTNIDQALRAVGNVTITGKYTPEELPELLAQTKGRLALFLPAWPETYSYTLSELVKHGFIALAPDIGAPADRIRKAGFGVVFPFPADAAAVLALIDEIAAGTVSPVREGALPEAFFSKPEDLERLNRIVLNQPRESVKAAPKPAKAKTPSPA
ncbi:glycosyltransferase [Acidocella facilis]|uniref:glycosyltransferase n=1 Tax=Acidocella facilis TaxID=525 RepID=UPI001F20090D|nr:glycosyltransferase [Acidocella facilis]